MVLGLHLVPLLIWWANEAWAIARIAIG